MKKLLVITICAILAAVFCAGCNGVYTPPIYTDPNVDVNPDDPGNDPGPETPEEGYTFTVSLIEGGKPYTPTPDQNIRARWVGDDGYSYEAEFNTLGVASHSGMDGDFRVTLSNIPKGYTYDPNGIYSNNNRRNVSVELLPIISPSGGRKGTEPYQDAIVMTQTGTYRATVSEKDEGLWYRFDPKQPGLYYVESWVDVSANEINPKLVRYSGSSAYINMSDYEDCDSGGSASTFTKNFRMVVNCAKDYVGNVWWFRLYADCVSEELYPATVDFTISYQGEATNPDGETVVITANGPFADNVDEGDQFFGFAAANVNLDVYGKQIGLGDDGFYHMYSTETGKYDGATVYVKLTTPTYIFEHYNAGDGFDEEPLDDAFLHCDYFHPEWAEQGGHLHSFPLRLGIGTYQSDDFFYKDYHAFISEYTGYDDTGKKTAEGHCNSDGAHPVNEELKTFLYEYAKNSPQTPFFKDGDGVGEIMGVDASEQYMWLFACGIYQ